MTKQCPDASSSDISGDNPVIRDNPEAYISCDRRHALSNGIEMPDRVRGCALFADISGFTPLTETLRNELGSQRGAEELTRHLDRVFHAVILELNRFGGNVIYFAGDAITCWFDGDDGLRGIACGLAMQLAIQRVGLVVTKAGTKVQMALKVAIAVGNARRTVVGDPEIQYIDVLAGSLLDRLAEAEHFAEKGDVLLDESAVIAVGDRVKLSEQRINPQSGRKLGVVSCLTIDVADAPADEPQPLRRSIVKKWLLPAVYERITAGRGELVAELRPAYPVFIRFNGIDFDNDEALDELNDFIVHAQRVFDNYGGNVLQLTLGDKGAYLYGVFGSPVAHEDDAKRAASAALELIRLDCQTAARDIQIGISHGYLFSGTYGHEMRRTFVCLGDAVNLAARLMSVARAGHIYVADDVREATGEAFIWEHLEPLKLKGKAKPVTASVLISSIAKASQRKTRYELPIVGRIDELNTLDKGLVQTLASHGCVIGISAEAGLGKSRLVAEFVRKVRSQNILVAFGECQSFGINTSYFVWREIWHRLLDVNEEDEAGHQLVSIESALKRIDPALVARAPLLSKVFGISIPDSELTASFDAKLRKSSLEDLLATCLRDRAAKETIVIVLEDSHWMDALSRDLLEALIRASVSLRVMVVLAYRPETEPDKDLRLASFSQFSEISLQELGSSEMNSVISFKAEQLFGNSKIPPDVFVDFIINRSQGNPFYAEELLNYVAGQGMLPTDLEALQSLELPDSLHSLVLSRIDSLAEDPRRTLKIASVIGRLFHAPSLTGVYPDLGNMDDVIYWLEQLQVLDLVTLDQTETLSYLFRHVVTHEVSYNSLPFTIRAELHRRVGEFIERTEMDDLEPHLDLLAHHFWNGDNEDKKREYLSRAEESARRRYANLAAIDYGERLATLVKGAELGYVLLRLGKVHELTGEWSLAESIENKAYKLAEEIDDAALKARCEVALAEVARKQGRYEEAVDRLKRAVLSFKSISDDEGQGLALHVSGTVAAQQGENSTARKLYEESLDIRQRLDDLPAVASLYSNLAIIAEYSGDYEKALSNNEQALSIRRDIGDQWGIGVSQNNIGMIKLYQQNYTEAQSRFEESIRLNREVGDPWMIALAQNNLGNATRELSDYIAARKHYATSLDAYRIYDDHWALAFLLEDISILAALTGAELLAFELLGAADAMREEIGSPRNPTLQQEIDRRLSTAARSIGKQKATSAQHRGRQHSIISALELALRFVQDEE